MRLTYDTALRRTTLDTTAATFLKRSRAERLEIWLQQDGVSRQLRDGGALIFTVKPATVGDGELLLSVTITQADYHAQSGTYRKTFSTINSPINALLAVDETSANDEISVTVRAELSYRPADDAEPGDTFTIELLNALYDEDEAAPDELPGPDDEWVAHGHVQSLTTEQKAQARENIGAAAESASSFTSGAGAPSGGADGDWYLRTSNLYLYQRISGVWTALMQGVPVT